MSINPALFTFISVPGTLCFRELEVFYFNQSSQTLESISASSKTVKKELKVPFGPLQRVNQSDKVIEIVNMKGVTLSLYTENLKPMLDKSNSELKKTLLNIIERADYSLLAKVINDEINMYHDAGQSGVEKEQAPSPDEVELTPPEDTDEFDDSYNSPSPSPNKEKYEGNSPNLNDSGLGRSQMQKLPSENGSDTSEVSPSQPLNRQISINVELTPKKAYNQSAKEVATSCDMSEKIKDIIKDVSFKFVPLEDIEVPAKLTINKQLVNELKVSLETFPDRTQVFLGLVGKVRDDKLEGKFEVWVNPELYVAITQICMVNGDDPLARIVSVIHYVDVATTDADTVGSFLNANSKCFSAILHEELMYQDLVRFLCTVRVSSNEVKSKEFAKNALRSFSKGLKNFRVLYDFSGLPTDFLNLFEKFMILYESNGLNGQNVSWKILKGKHYKLEVPLVLISHQLGLSDKTRTGLLRALLSKKITLPQYKSRLLTAFKVENVKKHVSKISGKEFSAMKEKFPEKLSDKALESFAGAQNNKSGMNDKFTNLQHHVRGLFSDETLQDVRESVKVSALDGLNLNELKILCENKRVVLVELSDDETLNNKLLFAVRNSILSGNIGIFYGKSDAELRLCLVDDEDFAFEMVYVKRSKTTSVPIISESGVAIEIIPVGIAAKKASRFAEGLKNFYPLTVEGALASILNIIVKNKDQVLFMSTSTPFDIDPNNWLRQKSSTINYLVMRSRVSDFKEKLDMKVFK